MTEDRPKDDTVVVPDEVLPEEPAQRLSWFRVGIVIAVVAVLAGGGAFVLRKVSSTPQLLERSWSVPYVDVTLTPTYEFQNPVSNPARDIALAFVVADNSAPCTPSWGGAYSMDQAKQAIELDRRITQLRAAGGDIMISFGGQANKELALACTDQTKLTTAYRSVVEKYGAKVVDFDIENADVADKASIERRARAIATIQKERTAAKHDLAVWVTLPVTTGGLTADGVALVKSTLAAGVTLTGVNVMTMDFGSTGHPTSDMLGATKSALEASAKQIAEIYAGQGVTLDDSQRWSHLGATPMMGRPFSSSGRSSHGMRSCSGTWWSRRRSIALSFPWTRGGSRKPGPSLPAVRLPVFMGDHEPFPCQNALYPPFEVNKCD
jgi:chitinase